MSFILQNIRSNEVDAQTIARAILDGEITLEECKATGKFDRAKREEVERIVGPALAQRELLRSIKEERDPDRGLKLCEDFMRKYPDSEYLSEVKKMKFDYEDQMIFDEARTGPTSLQVDKLQRYIATYSNGNYVRRARQIIDNIKLEKIEDKKRLIDNIVTEKIAAHQVLEMLDNGSLSESDLVPEHISKKGLNRFKYGKDISFNINEELGPIRKGCTDIYFIGVPGSGKSCLLAGLLLYMQRYYKPMLSIEAENMAGKKYADSLISYAADGLVPGSTSADERSINYIATMIQNEFKPELYHPINFIEMSGEHIITAYEQFNNTIDTLPFHQYLTQDNDKYFFIVVDYVKALDDTDQGKYLDTIIQYFRLFQDYRILERTKAINLILTKSDLLDGGKHDAQFAEDFINRDGSPYHNLYAQLAELYRNNPFMGQGRKTRWNILRKNPQKAPKIYPFSLGQFELFNVSFRYDKTPSERLFQDIINNTSLIKRK